MNFMNRAWLYIVRKRGKSILLFVILLVMATFVLTALALGNASKAAQQELRQSLGGSFLIGFDYTENNPYLKVESVDGGTLIYSTQQIRPELVEQIREIEGIKECSATVEGLAAFPSLELFTGNIPIEEEFRASSKILSAWKSEELTRFTSGQLMAARSGTPTRKTGALYGSVMKNTGASIAPRPILQKVKSKPHFWPPSISCWGTGTRLWRHTRK